MNREDIKRMARLAGAVFPADGSYHSFERMEDLEAFAKLVAAAEREECALLCEDEAWRLKKVAIDNNSKTTNMRAIQASNDADNIRARGEE